jgi:hypothetical protein
MSPETKNEVVVYLQECISKALAANKVAEAQVTESLLTLYQKGFVEAFPEGNDWAFQVTHDGLVASLVDVGQMMMENNIIGEA